MAVFDPDEQRLCVRIVYDGVAGAGKTTNVRQLCALFATQRATEVYCPAEADGRTLFFDWAEIAAGVICGYPLMCQIVSVPGQLVLTPRRQALLESADIVIHVCDSSETGLRRARSCLDLAVAVTGRNVPMVLQANKQDHPDAIDGAALAATLGLDQVPVIEAIASDGIGVVDTFVAAVRAVSRAMRERVAEGNFRVPVRSAERARSVLAKLEHQSVDPEWAAEMLLEEANASLLVAERPPPIVAEGAKHARPALPRADVPPGFIWPAHTGRATLATLVGERAVAAPACDALGHVAVPIGRHVFRTTVAQRFTDREHARQALVRAARAQAQLGRLAVPETVLVAQPAPDDAWWVWTLAPTLRTVGDRLDAGDRELLRAFTAAVVEALRAARRHGFSIDVSPSSFGDQDGAIRYVGEIGEGVATDVALAAAVTAAAAAEAP